MWSNSSPCLAVVLPLLSVHLPFLKERACQATEGFQRALFLYKNFYCRRILIILYLSEHFTVHLFSSNWHKNTQDLPIKIIPAWEFKNPVCPQHKPLLPEAAGRIPDSLGGFRCHLWVKVNGSWHYDKKLSSSGRFVWSTATLSN